MSEPINRREFLKLTAVGAAVVAGLRGEAPASHELILNSRILVLDFFNVPTPENTNLLEQIPQTDEETRSIVQAYYESQFGNHGNLVLSQMEKAAAELEEKFTKKDITVVSITPSVSVGDVQKDELGNITVIAEVSDDYIDDLVSQSSASVVNMSFEVGKIKVKGRFYERKMSDEEIDKFNSMGFTAIKVNGHVTYRSSDGKTYSEAEYYKLLDDFSSGPIVELSIKDRRISHEDGYSGENVYGNLEKLAGIARNHPDKFFVAAGGNPDIDNGKRPDIRNARKLLEEQGLWPQNLIIIGYVAQHPYSHQVEPMQFGSDFYIQGVDASSLATAYTTELITKFINNGADRSSLIKLALLEQSVSKSVDATDSSEAVIEYRLLN